MEISRIFLHGEKHGKFKNIVKIAHKVVLLIFLSLYNLLKSKSSRFRNLFLHVNKIPSCHISGMNGHNYSESRPPNTSMTSSTGGHHGPTSASAAASSIWKSLRKKYVLLCCLCGGLCLALGVLYLVIYFVLGRYTSSLHYFQTMPLYIPAIVVSFP